MSSEQKGKHWLNCGSLCKWCVNQNVPKHCLICSGVTPFFLVFFFFLPQAIVFKVSSRSEQYILYNRGCQRRNLSPNVIRDSCLLWSHRQTISLRSSRWITLPQRQEDDDSRILNPLERRPRRQHPWVTKSLLQRKKSNGLTRKNEYGYA